MSSYNYEEPGSYPHPQEELSSIPSVSTEDARLEELAQYQEQHPQQAVDLDQLHLHLSSGVANLLKNEVQLEHDIQQQQQQQSQEQVDAASAQHYHHVEMHQEQQQQFNPGGGGSSQVALGAPLFTASEVGPVKPKRKRQPLVVMGPDGTPDSERIEKIRAQGRERQRRKRERDRAKRDSTGEPNGSVASNVSPSPSGTPSASTSANPRKRKATEAPPTASSTATSTRSKSRSQPPRRSVSTHPYGASPSPAPSFASQSTTHDHHSLPFDPSAPSSSHYHHQNSEAAPHLEQDRAQALAAAFSRDVDEGEAELEPEAGDDDGSDPLDETFQPPPSLIRSSRPPPPIRSTSSASSSVKPQPKTRSAASHLPYSPPQPPPLPPPHPQPHNSSPSSSNGEHFAASLLQALQSNGDLMSELEQTLGLVESDLDHLRGGLGRVFEEYVEEQGRSGRRLGMSEGGELSLQGDENVVENEQEMVSRFTPVSSPPADPSSASRYLSQHDHQPVHDPPPPPPTEPSPPHPNHHHSHSLFPSEFQHHQHQHLDDQHNFPGLGASLADAAEHIQMLTREVAEAQAHAEALGQHHGFEEGGGGEGMEHQHQYEHGHEQREGAYAFT